MPAPLSPLRPSVLALAARARAGDPAAQEQLDQVLAPVRRLGPCAREAWVDAAGLTEAELQELLEGSEG